ncbi:hypothetical protein BX265_5821 [Streptomyces sp. TLI_235]|nr:hypothetical protein [Streptomyces sp. TLI_235]PBC71224.1 hypothetical protein BX265_5821 [Streptomyces sp. TLI_235]
MRAGPPILADPPPEPKTVKHRVHPNVVGDTAELLAPSCPGRAFGGGWGVVRPRFTAWCAPAA